MYITGIPNRLSECGQFYEPIKDSEEYRKYKQCSDEQIRLWLQGTSTMNQWHENPDYWESCPDFSNEGQPIWPLEQRQLFINSSNEVREQMCMMVLGTLLKDINLDKEIYVSGNVIEQCH